MKKILLLTFLLMSFSAIFAGTQVRTKENARYSLSGNGVEKGLFDRNRDDLRYPLGVPVSRAFNVYGQVMSPIKKSVVTPLPTDLCGSVIYNMASTRGMKIVPQTIEQQFQMLAPDVVANRGGVLLDGIYYLARSEGYLEYTFFIDSYNPETWELIETRETTIEMMSSDMAVDPNTGEVYGCFFASLDNITGFETYAFGKADFQNLTMTPICSLGSQPWSACAIDADGKLYAIDMQGCLLEINKSTGDVIRNIGNTGLEPYYTSSGIIEQSTGRFFYTLANYYSAGLYEINKETGAATLLVDFIEQENVTGLFFPEPAAVDGAPGEAANVTVDFIDASLSGTVNFTSPANTYGGAPLSGDIGYKLFQNRELIAQDDAPVNTTISIPVQVSASGEYEFTVLFSNKEGDGPKTHVKTYIGHDTPHSPVITNFSLDSGVFTVSWDAVTDGIHGGYVNRDRMTYNVLRYPDSVVVGEELSTTTITDAVPVTDNLALYYYAVTAVSEGMESAPAMTSKISVGEIHPPYFPDFTGDDALVGYSIIDLNNDGQVWETFKWDADDAVLRLKYNSTIPLDDWLITPPIALEKDKRYKVSFKTYAQDASYPERMEVMWGDAPKPEAMTNVIMEASDVTASQKTPQIVENYIAVPETGNYYIGFHGISGVYTYYLYVDDFEISGGMGTEVPGKVTDLNVIPDAKGLIQADIAFTAPSLNMNGETLSAKLTKVELYRNLKLIHTFENPESGSHLAYTDIVGVTGVHSYRAIAYSEDGAGLPSADVACYLGANIPGKVQNLEGVEIDGDGKVTVSWDAPAVDIDGYYIVPAIITYTLVDISNPDNPVTLAEKTSETSFTYQAVPAGSNQTLCQWQVTAYTEAGSGIDEKSVFLPVGKPYKCPYRESFPGGMVNNIVFAYNIYGKGMFDLFTDDLGIISFDGDNGYAGMVGVKENDSAALGMGKIEVPVENPAVWLYCYNINTGADNKNTIDIEVNAGNGWERVKQIVMADLPVTGAWNRVTLQMDKYAGKILRFRFVGTTRTYTNTLIDNVNVGTLPDYDMAAEHIVVPDCAFAGQQFSITAIVANHGAKTVEGYEVALCRNGEVVETKSGMPIEPGMRSSVEFVDKFDVMSPAKSEYSVVVTHKSDLAVDDNRTKTVSVNLLTPDMPVVTDLQGEQNANAVSLTWGLPDMSTLKPDRVTESFENAESFAIDNVEGWTFVDVDKSTTWKLSGNEFPNQGLPMAYIVFDSTHFDDEYLMANTGNKYLACMASQLDEPEHNDDWLISPRLYGLEQTVSFYASSYTVQYGYELIEVYYSNGGTDIKEFVKVSGNQPVPVPEGWAQYDFVLPEGATHFAIRCISPNRCALLIDDISYIPDAPLPDMQIIGYNVYSDGVKLNETPVVERNYMVTVADELNHRYGVTVIYDRGESAISNIINLECSGVENVLENSGRTSGNVYNIQGVLVLENATLECLEKLVPGVYIFNGRKVMVE